MNYKKNYFETHHLGNLVTTSFFEFLNFSGSLEMFLGYCILLVSLFSISIQSVQKLNFQTQNYLTKITLPNYYNLGSYIFFLSFLLILNENYLLFFDFNISFCSPDVFLLPDYLSFITKSSICFSVFIYFLSLHISDSSLSLKNSFEYLSFIMAGTLGSLVLCSSADFITSYLALELQSISFYLMVASKKNSTHSIDGSLKYFIVGAFSSSFFLLGTTFVYFSFGTVDYNELRTLISLIFDASSCASQVNLAQIGFLLIGISLFIKIAAAPFHLWSIDVYESSSSSTTYFLFIIPKIALFTLLHRIFYYASFNLFVTNFSFVCLIVAVLSVGFSSIAGLEEKKLKSLLSYSAVGHTGYMLLAFGSANEFSTIFLFYYLTFYVLASFCFWFVYLFLKKKKRFKIKKSNKELGDLTLLYKSNPALAFVLGVSLFSMSGIPPLAGFLIKFGVFTSSVFSHFFLAAIISMLFSLISTFFYLRIIKVIFFENTLTKKLYKPIKSKNAILIASFTLFIILFFLKPSILYLITSKCSLLLN